MKLQILIGCATLCFAGCAEPLVGEWRISTWKVDAILTDCENDQRLITHEESDVGSVTFLTDGSVLYDLKKHIPDFYRAYVETPFDAVDLEGTGTWKRNDDAIEIEGLALNGYWTTSSDNVLIDGYIALSSPAGFTIFEPCGRGSISNDLVLQR